MGRAVVVGHGGFNKDSTEVLVPPNTTIQFLADAGSNLELACITNGPKGSGWVEGKNCYFDYEKITNVLNEFLQAEDPVEEGKVVYNFFTEPLGAESQEVAQKLQDAGKWGAEKFTKEPAKLCTGTAASCPTPKLNVAQRLHDQIEAKTGADGLQAVKGVIAAGGMEPLPEILANAGFSGRLADVPAEMRDYVVDGVPADRWNHRCDGLLTKFAGSDIVWVSCAGFAVNQQTLDELELSTGLPSEIRSNTRGPDSAAGDAEGLVPLTDADKDAMRGLRVQKYKDTPMGGEITVRASQELVVLGSDYAGNIENTVKRQVDLAEGKAKKVSFAGKLKTLEVTGIPTGLQERVKGVFTAVMTDAGDPPDKMEFK
jgi:hypothetical protein